MVTRRASDYDRLACRAASLPLRRHAWIMKILIADDSPIVRKRLSDLLGELEGVVVVGEAENAAKARLLARHLNPDVAILDLRLGDASGSEVLRDIKQRNPGSTVIMLTNYSDLENRNECIGLGADYFFDKSIEFEKAVAVLQDMLGKEH